MRVWECVRVCVTVCVSFRAYTRRRRVGIDLIKLIKSSINSLIKSMQINQGVDLFDFFKIICICDHRCMTLD